jgi:mono/diheme cytochrome c family protein
MLPASVTPAMIAMGDSIYHARGCRNCHGADAKGTNRAPDLTDATLLHVNGSYDDYVRIITDGVPVAAMKDSSHTNAMPARGGARPAILTDDQIKAVAAYVFTLRK